MPVCHDATKGKRLSKLTEYFDAGLKALLGQQAGGEIEVNAQGVFPRPNRAAKASGAALSTSTVLAFDLACLIGSICGIGHHPRLLFHDSPREADMETEMYHLLLHFAARLDAHFADREPSFQYVITTTTPPPQEFNSSPFTCLELDARSDDGLLLKRAF
jgi:hypothetical protein